MTNPNVIGDTHVNGALTCNSFNPPSGCIDNDAIQAGAEIQYAKLEHLHRATYQQGNVAAVADTRVIGVVVGAEGVLRNFKVGSIAVCTGNATITVDLKKNGTSVLASVVTLNSSNSPRVAVNGTITTTGLVAGDVLEVVVAVNAGTGALGTGVFASVNWSEDAL